MPVRHLPVRPDLEQLRRQAKELLAGIRAGAPDALSDLATYHPKAIDPAVAKLADAQLVLARSYQVSSWNRLVQACDLVDAIWRDDLEAVRALVTSARTASTSSRQIASTSSHACTRRFQLGT